MPITGIASYTNTMRDVRLHWESLLLNIPPYDIRLPGQYTYQNFVDEATAVDAAIIAATGAALNERLAAAQLAILREPMAEHINKFRQSVALNLGKTRFSDRAPLTPNKEAGEALMRTRLDMMSDVWRDINAATDLAPFLPPLQLPGGYIPSAFNTGRAALYAAYEADAAARRDATAARANRNALLPPIRERMVQYRAACLLELPKGSPFLADLPRITPLPGTTPPALIASGVWDNVLLKARCTWTALTAEDILKYGITKIQVRGCLGAYKSENEEVVADLPVDATHWEGDWGLTAPDSIASFKFYSMTATGNEAGGKAVKIVRPTE